MNKFQNSKFSDFEIIETLAQTHQDLPPKFLYAKYLLSQIQAITKQSLKNNAKAVQHIHNQKQALQYFTKLDNINICKYEGSFQDQKNLYLILEMAEGLPFHKLMQMMGSLKLDFVKFLTYQVGLILRNFHNEGYIYRDIKASNFMVNQHGKVKMIDLGKAKQIKKQRAYTICGTSHSMPPQIYKKQGYSYQFDYYSFGVLIYQLIVKKPPFGYQGSNKNIIEDCEAGLTQDILKLLPDNQSKDIIRQLMDKNPKNRLGVEGGFSHILQHPFFNEYKELADQVYNGEQQLSEYDDNFREQISQIVDFGLSAQKYEQIDDNDPFYKFLG